MYIIYIIYIIFPYILKAKKSEDSAFQSKKYTEKGSTSKQQNFAIKVGKSIKSL